MAPADRIAAVRRFNRFYTQKIGVLGKGLLDSPFSLTEARLLYELSHRDGPTATALGRDLDIDPGYLSRLLAQFEKRGLLARSRSRADLRQAHLSLTARGQAAFAPVETRQQQAVGAMLDQLSDTGQRRLIGAVRTIEQLLGSRADAKTPYRLRSHQAGDMGWVVQRHGALYAQEYGYDATFEALVARIVADFLDDFDPACERCWIAEKDGEPVGSVFLVKKSTTVAKLRLLLLEPKARGLGIGARLVNECIRFARRCGYKRITLWTQSELAAARHLYERAGFRRVAQKKHHSFGNARVAETWEMDLGSRKSQDSRGVRGSRS
jgi:DNA-binding MarR family transcriptional regulator/GNAT superfamily N-acetyltransferase